MSEHVTADGYQPEGDNSLAKTLAERCLADAQAEGIPKAEIDDAFEDLDGFLAGEIEEANDREATRLADKDD